MELLTKQNKTKRMEDFKNMSRENLRQLIAELEAENKQNWLDWFEDPIEPGS